MPFSERRTIDAPWYEGLTRQRQSLLVGTEMLAVPALASLLAYAVTGAFRWRSGLDQRVIEVQTISALSSHPFTRFSAGGGPLNYYCSRMTRSNASAISSMVLDL